jgi:hypothetical protein
MLIIDDNVIAAAKALVEYAEKNPYSVDELLDIANGDLKAPGDQYAFRMHIPVGYMVVFTIDVYPHGRFRHLSMSSSRPGMLPRPEAVDMVLPLFGFNGSVRECRVDFEPADNPIAISVIEPITPG